MNRQFWALSILVLWGCFACHSFGGKKELAREYYNIATAYGKQKKYEKAVEYYERSLALAPDFNQTILNLARAYVETGEHRKAASLLKKLALQEPENLMVKEMQAYALYRSGETEKAAVVYDQCLEIDPLHERSLYNMALLSKEQEKFTAARNYLERLLKIDDKEKYRKLLAELADKNNEKDKALLEYENLLADSKGNKEVYRALKKLYMEKKRYEDAVKMLALLAKEVPKEEKPLVLWEKSRMEFLFMDDFVNGRNDLKAALEAGFKDEEKIGSLVKELKPSWQKDVHSVVEAFLVKEEEPAEKKESQIKNLPQEDGKEKENKKEESSTLKDKTGTKEVSMEKNSRSEADNGANHLRKEEEDTSPPPEKAAEEL